MNFRDIDLMLCPICGALSPTGAAFDHHVGWHAETETMQGWLYQDAIKRAQNLGDFLDGSR